MNPEIRLRLHQMRLHQALKDRATYRSRLRSYVRGLWNDTFDIIEFYDGFERNIRSQFRAAWLEGMAEAGLSAEDMTTAEQKQLDDMIFDEFQYIMPFGSDILANSKANGGPIQPHFDRVELWVKRYLNVKNQALQMAQSDPVLLWTTHADESCTSCLKLNGQRRRSSTWERVDLRPQHPDRLECMRSAGGVDVCKCTFSVTTQPPTRGRLPKV